MENFNLSFNAYIKMKNMITKFKIFENINKQPKVGDYVIIDADEFNYFNDWNENVINFIKSNIGQIQSISSHVQGPNDESSKVRFYIKFENVPDNISYSNFKNRKPRSLSVFSEKDIRGFLSNDIKYWSNNKDELEAILQSKKYNL